jgi:hypothetical protein
MTCVAYYSREALVATLATVARLRPVAETVSI